MEEVDILESWSKRIASGATSNPPSTGGRPRASERTPRWMSSHKRTHVSEESESLAVCDAYDGEINVFGQQIQKEPRTTRLEYSLER